MPEITVYSRTPHTGCGLECGGQRITLTGPIKKGGEGMVYAVKYSKGICAKIYYKEKINAELRNKVTAMINNPPGENLTGEGDSSRSSLISWAISALYDSNMPDAHFLGFTMPLIDTSMFREAHRYYDPDDRIKYLGGSFSWLYLLTAAFNIASVVSAIHLKGHRIGDMSASNILVARTAAVSFIDCDSFQITDAATKKTYYTKVATGDFLPPELMGVNFRTDNIDRYYSDLFALGVLIFKFLMNGFHPYQARGAGVEKLPTIEAKIKQGKFAYEGTFADVKPPKNAPPYAMISPELRMLFHRCFVTGHAEKEKRPTASEWAAALKNEIANIKRCERNGNHCYSGSLKKCPWCAVMAANPGMKDPFPPSKTNTGGNASKVSAATDNVTANATTGNATAVSKPAAEAKTGGDNKGNGKDKTNVNNNGKNSDTDNGNLGLSQPATSQPVKSEPPKAKPAVPPQNTPPVTPKPAASQPAASQPAAPKTAKVEPPKIKPPVLSVKKDSIETKVMRDADAEFVITVENAGEDTLAGTMRSDSDWLVFADGGNSLNFAADTVFETKSRIIASKLPANTNPVNTDATFIGKIAVSSNGGRSEIAVKVTFAADPVLKTDRKKILIKDANVASGAGCVIRGGFTVTNAGEGILKGTVTANREWMRAVPDVINVNAAESIDVAVEIDTEKAPGSVLLFGKLNIDTNGGKTEITVGVTIQK